MHVLLTPLSGIWISGNLPRFILLTAIALCVADCAQLGPELVSACSCVHY